MKSKTARLHSLLVLLALAMASILFVAACGGGEATAGPQESEVAEVAEEAEEAKDAAATAEAAAAEAAATAEVVAAAEVAKAYELAETAAQVAEETDVAEVGEEGGPKYGGTLIVTLAPNLVGLDPIFITGEVGIVINQQVYDNLLMIQPDLSVKPELATSWEPNEDFTSYTFHLREGVKFHHGKEFKAEDVVFNVNRWVDPVLDSSMRPTFEVIKEMVVIDDYTIRFDLVAPNAFFPTYFSIFGARILPADVDVDRLTLEEFGSGPFMIDEHLPGQRTTLVRNPDYWEEGRPYLDEIVVLSINEPATRAESLKSGDVDVIYKLTPQSVPNLEAHSDTTVLKATSFSYIALPMPTNRPPFDNKLVRKAFQAATDREAINQAALLGLGIVARDHPIHPAHPAFAPQYAPPDYNPELAKSLLEQAGYPDGVEVTLHTADVGPGMIELAVAFKESAAPAGIRVNVERVSPDGFWDVVWNNDLFTVVYWFGRIPDQALSIQTHSESAWNAPNYNNPVVDALIVKARGQDLEGRKETYGEIQRILIDDVPRIVPAFQPWLYGARNNVRGADPHPLGWPFFQDAWIDD